jgi:hypothetical protein
LTPEQTVDLLTLVQSFDRRTVGKTDVAAWHLAVGDLSFGDSQDAVIGHYQDSRDWIMPADVRRRVKAARAERLSLTPLPDPPAAVANDPDAYQAWLGTERKRIADGPNETRAIGAL